MATPTLPVRRWAPRLALLAALALAPGILFGSARLLSSLSRPAAQPVPALPQGPDLSQPPDLHGAAAALDLTTRDLVLFGGYHAASGGHVTDETWTWDGQDWRRLRPSTAPPPRRDAVAVLDLVSRHILVTGGFGGSARTPLNDVWGWDGRTWALLPAGATRPHPASLPLASWDSRDRSLLLVCTTIGPGGRQVETWEYRDGTWTQRAAPREPVLRGPALMSSDPTNGHSLLVAPGPIEGGPADTWSWDGMTWNQMASTPSGFSPLTARMSADGIVAGDVLLVQQPATTWTWDGTHWEVARGSSIPPVHGALVATLGSPILFGGRLADQDLAEKFRWVYSSWVQLGPPVRGGDQVIGRRDMGTPPPLPS